MNTLLNKAIFLIILITRIADNFLIFLMSDRQVIYMYYTYTIYMHFICICILISMVMYKDVKLIVQYPLLLKEDELRFILCIYLFIFELRFNHRVSDLKNKLLYQ